MPPTRTLISAFIVVTNEGGTRGEDDVCLETGEQSGKIITEANDGKDLTQ